MKWLYRGHEGGLYVLDEYEEPETCQFCGDSDDCLGPFETLQECYDLLLYTGNMDVGALGWICFAYCCGEIFGPTFDIPEYRFDWAEIRKSDDELLEVLKGKGIDVREEYIGKGKEAEDAFEAGDEAKYESLWAESENEAEEWLSDYRKRTGRLEKLAKKKALEGELRKLEAELGEEELGEA